MKCASTLKNIYNTTKAAGNKKTITIWFEISKRGAALQYESSNAVEARFQKTLALLKKAGLLKRQLGKRSKRSYGRHVLYCIDFSINKRSYYHN